MAILVLIYDSTSGGFKVQKVGTEQIADMAVTIPKIDDSDPFIIQQTSAPMLQHLPYGSDYGAGPTYHPIHVDASGYMYFSAIWPDNSVTSAKIAANAIGGAHILDGSLGGAELANQAITSAKIGALAVGTPHLAALAIVSGKVASGGLSPLTSGKIWAGFTGNMPREENKPVAATKELFVIPNYGTEQGGFGNLPIYRLNAEADEAYISFYVPNDFSSITEAVVAVGARATATHRLNFSSYYFAKNEIYNTHTESDLDVDTAMTNLYGYEIDISGILSNLAAGDYVGIKVLGDAVNTPNLDVLGVRFKYA